MSNLDAIGAWPPKRDSHVEMDGAWALYEAWLRLQEGDIEIAVVTGSGRSSTGDPALIYPMEMDPYFLAPLGADPLTFAALQARAVIAAGIADERSMAEVAVRARGKGDVESLLAEDFVRQPLRRHDVPPITDGAAAMVLATGDRARQLVERPAYITGFDHRTECHNPSFRALDDSPSTRIAAEAAGLGDAPVEVAELQAAFTHEELLLRKCPRPRGRRGGEPLRGGAAGQSRSWPPDCAGWATPPTTSSGAAAGPWPMRPPGRACNRTSSASWRDGHEHTSGAPSSGSARPTTSPGGSTCPSAVWCGRPSSGPSTTPR